MCVARLQVVSSCGWCSGPSGRQQVDLLDWWGSLPSVHRIGQHMLLEYGSKYVLAGALLMASLTALQSCCSLNGFKP